MADAQKAGSTPSPDTEGVRLAREPLPCHLCGEPMVRDDQQWRHGPQQEGCFLALQYLDDDDDIAHWNAVREPLRTAQNTGRDDVLEEAARALRNAAKAIHEMMPPEEQSNGWKLGFCRMRKNAKDLLLGHASAFHNAAIEGDCAVGAGRLDHPLRHPLEAAIIKSSPPVSTVDEEGGGQ